MCKQRGAMKGTSERAIVDSILMYSTKSARQIMRPSASRFGAFFGFTVRANVLVSR